MKSTLALTSTITLMLVACSQNKSANDALRQADRLISVMPDSAINILESIDCKEADKETQACHALLLAKANEKALRRFHNDSITTMGSQTSPSNP